MKLSAGRPIHILNDMSANKEGVKINNSIYQKRSVSICEIIEHINLNPENAPQIILSVSPVRSGSTALMRVFAAAGIQTHFQELKNILRWLMIDGVHNWTPGNDIQMLMLKEALGPYTKLECAFNPMRVLLGAGLPPKNLYLVIMGRSPVKTWASWKALWGDATNPALFAKAYQTTEQIRSEGKKRGIHTTCVCYEIFKDNKEEVMVKRLFHRLGLTCHPCALKGWSKLPTFGTPGSNIVFPHEPEPFSMPDGLVKVIQAEQFSYLPGDHYIDYIEEADKTTIAKNGLFDIYENWFRICQEDLS